MGFILSPYEDGFSAAMKMQEKFLKWAFDALVDYVSKHGHERAKQLADFLLELLKRAEDQLFSAPAYPAGLEDECARLSEEFAALKSKDD